MEQPAQIAARFEAVSAWMTQAELWVPRPFVAHRLPWEAKHPTLSTWLRGLTHDQITALEEAPEGDPDAHPTYLEWAAQARGLTALPTLSAPPVAALSPHWVKSRIKGRKWSQILAFSELITMCSLEGAGPVVDWCGGQGHLGRSLGVALGRSVTVIERNAATGTQGGGPGPALGGDAAI